MNYGLSRFDIFYYILLRLLYIFIYRNVMTRLPSGHVMSISLCSHEISKGGKGSLLSVTLQITSLTLADLFQGYHNGWSASFDNLSALASNSEQS